MIQIGPVTLGRDVYVGEMTVLDIGTAMGDGAQLGHSSSLHTGQSVPAGERWHGSPASRPRSTTGMVRTGRLSFLRRVMLPLLQLAAPARGDHAGGARRCDLRVPAGPAAGRAGRRPRRRPSRPGPSTATRCCCRRCCSSGRCCSACWWWSPCRALLRLLVRPDRDYRLYGFRYWAHRTIGRMTNRMFFTRLYGDSSYIVHYLRGIGYDLGRVEQTGSNFGTDVKHDNPFLSSVGRGTVVADGLSFINADYSSTHFRVSRVAIGAHNFLGQPDRLPGPGPDRRQLPAGHQGHGAAGRAGPGGRRPARLAQLRDPAHRRAGPPAGRDRSRGAAPQAAREEPAQHHHHPAVPAVPLGAHRRAHRAHAGHRRPLLASSGCWSAALAGILVLPLTTGYFLLLDRLCAACRRTGRTAARSTTVRSGGTSGSGRSAPTRYLQLFNGTPFKNLIWRLLGVRIGRRVFDDGCSFTERSFVTHRRPLHAQRRAASSSATRRRTARSSPTAARSAPAARSGWARSSTTACTIGAGALLEADSFLMKGSEVPAGRPVGRQPGHGDRRSSPMPDPTSRPRTPASPLAGSDDRSRGARKEKR